MSTVLPEKALTHVRRTNDARLATAAALVFGFCALIALLALIPSYMFVQAESSSLARVPPLSKEEEAERDSIMRAQMLLRDLKPIASSTVSMTIILEEILAARPAGTLVSSVAIERGERGVVLVGGSAPSREEIEAFRAALSRYPGVKSATVPLQNLTGRNSDFTITLTGTF